MRFIIFPYKLGSRSARSLTDGLRELGRRSLMVRPDGQYRYRAGDRIINWGNSQTPVWMSNEAVQNTLNKPHAVRSASNKLLCFQTLYSAEIPTVPFTTDQAVARGWGADVYVRHTLNGHSGEGIEIVRPTLDSGVVEELATLERVSDALSPYDYEHIQTDIDEAIRELALSNEYVLPDAPLYTKRVENNGEYRIHVFNGEVIDYRKKSRRHEDEPLEGQSDIRTLSNGWVYRSENLRRLERIEGLAVSAIEALGLDFGAVDIIKDENGDYFILEINTAVGMEDTTLENYLQAIIAP